MKHFLFFLLLMSSTVFYLSCSDGAEEEPMDTEWILVQQLLDPGEGSGQFVDVQSDKSITLKTDSTFTSNGDICTMSIDATGGSSGTYDTEFLYSDNCNSNLPDLRYEISGDELVISYPCIEPCKHKYNKK